MEEIKSKLLVSFLDLINHHIKKLYENRIRASVHVVFKRLSRLRAIRAGVATPRCSSSLRSRSASARTSSIACWSKSIKPSTLLVAGKKKGNALGFCGGRIGLLRSRISGSCERKAHLLGGKPRE